MNIRINYGNDVFTLPRTAADNLVQADMTDLKTLILLASDAALRENCDSGEIAKRVGCRRDKAEASLRFWSETGLITQTESDVGNPDNSAEKDTGDIEDKEKPQNKHPTDQAPVYSGDELKNMLDENEGSRRRMLDECQNIAGKMFNVLEINKVIAMSEYLGLENEHILMLFAYCRERGKTSVHYVERTAYNLYNEGVDTLVKLETYIREKEACEDSEREMRKLFGLGDRTLTPSERSYIKRWTTEFGYPTEIIERAYQIMIDNTRNGKVSLAYMNRILDNWHTAGYTAIDEIDAALLAYKSGREQSGKNEGGSFDTDEFYALALKKSYEDAK